MASKDFIPTNLYIDMMLMIKNTFFCVAKAKVDNPEGEFWIILLGTDRLEELFGILRTMVGNDANLDMYQLIGRIVGTTEVSNILAKYPHWDHLPQHLRGHLSSLSHDAKEIPDRADHIKPASWRGNVKVKDVSLQTSWNCGRNIIEQDSEVMESVLGELDNSEAVNILSPFGILLVDAPLTEDDIDESLEFLPQSTASEITELSSEEMDGSDANTRVEVETALEKFTTDSAAVRNFDRDITFRGTKTSKAHALARFSKDRKRHGPRSTDRLRHVQDVERHPTSKNFDDEPSHNLDDDAEVLFVLDLILSLPVVRCENQLWLAIGEVTSIKVDGRSVPYVTLDMLEEDTVTVSYQMLGLRPATSDDDPEGKHDWRTYAIDEKTHTVPGRLIQPINPTV